MEEIKENDLVARLVDLSEHGLRRGDVGTVIEIFSKNEKHPAGYIVEFVTKSGSVYTQAEITNPAEIMPVRSTREPLNNKSFSRHIRSS